MRVLGFSLKGMAVLVIFHTKLRLFSMCTSLLIYN